MAGQNVTTLRSRKLERLLQSAGGQLLERLAAEAGTNSALVLVVLTQHAEAPADVPQCAHRAPARGPESGLHRGRRTALIRRRREVCKTQEGLAADVGVLRSTVARWESGHTTPSLWARPRLANALRVSLDMLDEILGAAPLPMVEVQVTDDIWRSQSSAVA